MCLNWAPLILWNEPSFIFQNILKLRAPEFGNAPKCRFLSYNKSGCHCRGCWSSNFKDWAKNDGSQRLCPFHAGSIARPPAKFVPTGRKSLGNLVASYYYFPSNFNFTFFTPRGGFPGWSAHCLPSPVEGNLWNAGFAHGPGDSMEGHELLSFRPVAHASSKGSSLARNFN